MAAAKDFRKADRVTHFVNWDRAGTVVVHSATVYSCGRVQMVLTDNDTGVELGRNFDPAAATGTQFGTRLAMEPEAIESLGIELATQFVIEERAAIEAKIAQYGASPGYVAAMRTELDGLHAPRVISAATAHEESRARVAAMVAAARGGNA